MEEWSASEIAKKNKNEIVQDTARDASAAIAGALIGVALGGGVPGAVAGSAASPLLTGAIKLISDVLQKRRRRAELIVAAAIQNQELSPEQTLEKLQADPEKVNAFVELIDQVTHSDPSFDAVLAAALSELIVSKESISQERILIVTDSIRGLRTTHMRVLTAIHRAGGNRTASDLATDIGIPEMELRSVVRDLELRGMIKDLNKHPIEWKLREMGQAIIKFSQNRHIEGPL